MQSICWHTRNTKARSKKGVIQSSAQNFAYLSDWAVCLQEVRLEEDVEEVARDTFDCIVNGQDMDALSILDISALQLHEHISSAFPHKHPARDFWGLSRGA